MREPREKLYKKKNLVLFRSHKGKGFARSSSRASMVLDTVVITEGEGVRRVDGGEEGGGRGASLWLRC